MSNLQLYLDVPTSWPNACRSNQPANYLKGANQLIPVERGAALHFLTL